MKYYIIPIIIVFVLFSCNTYKDVESPNVYAELSATNVGVNEAIKFTFHGDADNKVVYTGDFSDKGVHIPGYIDTATGKMVGTGFVVKKDIFYKSYAYEDTFDVKIIYTNNNKNATEIKQKEENFKVIVSASSGESNELTNFMLYRDTKRIEVASTIDDNTIYIKVPNRPTPYSSTKTNLTRQRVTAQKASVTSTIFINDILYEIDPNSEGGIEYSIERYDLTGSATVSVFSKSNIEKKYTLYTLFYPEFVSSYSSSIKRDKANFYINGIKQEMARTSDYSKFYIPIPLDANSDSILSPTFNTFETRRITVNGEEQTSGVSEHNFAEMVKYELENWRDEDKDKYHITSEVFVSRVIYPECTSFSIPNGTGIITPTADSSVHDITINMTADCQCLTSVKPFFTFNNAKSVTFGSIEQTSGVTEVDLSNGSGTYTVTNYIDGYKGLLEVTRKFNVTVNMP